MRMLKGNSGAGSGKWRKLMGTVIPPSRIRRSRRGLITRSNASFTQQRLRSPSIIFHPNRFHLSFDWSNLPHFVSDSSSRFQWRIPAIKSGVVIPKWIQFHHSSIGRRQFEYSVRLSWIWFKWWLSPWEENGAMEKHRECCCAVCIFVSLFSSRFLFWFCLLIYNTYLGASEESVARRSRFEFGTKDLIRWKETKRRFSWPTSARPPRESRFALILFHISSFSSSFFFYLFYRNELICFVVAAAAAVVTVVVVKWIERKKNETECCRVRFHPPGSYVTSIKLRFLFLSFISYLGNFGDD